MFRPSAAVADEVLISLDGGVADVRLNRPAKLNALDSGMFEALGVAGDRLRSEPDLRAVVLSGEGSGFCAGLDLERMRALCAGEALLPFADLTKRTHGAANFAQHIVWQWRELPVPVIAAVHGAAIGGGLQLALGADFRIVAPDARLAAIEAKWGLVPDMAGFQLMAELMRYDLAADLIFSARTISGREAVTLGLATRLAANPRTAALKAAFEIAGQSPDAIRAAKRLLGLRSNAGAVEYLSAETAEQMRLIAGANHKEAVSANFERRPPRFRAAG